MDPTNRRYWAELNILAKTDGSDPYRDLLATILLLAIKDVFLGVSGQSSREPNWAEDAREFLLGPEAAFYADLLGLPPGCIRQWARRNLPPRD
jgi:hypothetical protein